MRTALPLLACFLALLSASAQAAPEDPGAQARTPDGPDTHARALLAATPGSQRARMVAAFTSPQRVNWHYVPRNRFGLPRGEMNADQRAHLDALLRSVLTETGFKLVYDIVRMEEVMYANVGARSRRRNPAWRNPGLYHVALFGTPASKARWGFRMEGHHLSLNITFVGSRIIGSEPTFFGASPDRVTRGSLHPGLRPLATQQDLAFAFLNTLSAEAKSQAVVSSRAPGEIVLRDRRDLVSARPQGVRVASLPAAAQARFKALWDAWHAPFRGPAADRSMPEDLTFSWRGATAPGRYHYYRVHSSTVVIEFSWHGDHIHSVVRHRSREFGMQPK